MYIFGGTNGITNFNDVYRLDASRMEWRVLESGGMPPSGRSHATMVLDHHRLYVFGGDDGNNKLNDLHVLDLTRLPPLPS